MKKSCMMTYIVLLTDVFKMQMSNVKKSEENMVICPKTS